MHSSIELTFKRYFLKALLLSLFFVLHGCGGSGGSDGGNAEPDNDNLGSDTRNHSVARLWNEVLLEAIRNDFARPTVHARNLFHTSAAMYDAWTVFSSSSTPYLLGKSRHGFSCDFNSKKFRINDHFKREEAISFAAYRLINHRFKQSPGYTYILLQANKLMKELGYNEDLQSLDLSNGSAASLGNYIANCYIQYGLQDGANEANGYAYTAYAPVNPVIEPELAGNPNIIDLGRWQVISLSLSIDQSGNQVASAPKFLGPEWGKVKPFALGEGDKTLHERNGATYTVYHDPGEPPYPSGAYSDEYKWNFALVSIWSSHLDPSSGEKIDISPKALGNLNIDSLPQVLPEYRNFYDTFAGGVPSVGRSINPVTGEEYPSQWVLRGDYTRVLAEFWADGPESETPPGHWFVILNKINDHPLLEKRLQGTGPILGPLEWDIKSYFSLGGAMHDVAITAWGIKGWYDFIRPVSAIRAMGDRGQSSSPELDSYHPDGLPLYAGYIELVGPGDPLAGDQNQHLGKIKLYTWRGPAFVSDAKTDVAGVGWILAENWWPYQRPTFVTPPFAGYISGHSTFSRAAAEVLTAFTGSEYFPGGIGEFEIEADNFLTFEKGPSANMKLQWATYRDASDQCSLSRIWGGIHPPADDLPGRITGEKIGTKAFQQALGLIQGL